MRMIGLAVVLAISLTLALAADAQQAGKVWRIGFLGSGTPTAWGRFGLEAIRLGLKDHGYVEGQNIRIEYRWAEDRYDRIPELAAELVRLNPDVIITYGTPSSLALKRATSAIPIVMCIIGNPVENAAVASLARPGGNITGSSFFSDEVTAKRLDILKTAHPALVRVGFLSSSPGIPQYSAPGKPWTPWRDPSTSSFSTLTCAAPTNWTLLSRV